MPHVVEINRIEQLAPYRFAWKALLAQTPGASIFHSLEWLETWWRHYAGEQRLRVLVVEHEGRPLGILPLVVAPESTRLGTVRVLTYPLAGWGSFYSPIGPEPAATLVAGLKHIEATPRDWSLLDLRWINRQQLDRRRTQRALHLAGLPAHEAIWNHTALVEFQDAFSPESTNPAAAWETYWQSRPAKFRQNLRRDERRASAAGELRHERYRPLGSAHGDDDPRWDLFETCVELAERSWQSAATDGTTLSHASVLPFLRDVHQLAARQGMLDVNVLYLGERPAAFAYNYVCEARVTGLRAGYDPAFGHLGVGRLLFRHALEDSALRGDVSYDFGPGSLAAKQAWLTRLAPIHHLVHYPADPRAQLLRVKHWWDAHLTRNPKDRIAG